MNNGKPEYEGCPEEQFYARSILEDEEDLEETLEKEREASQRKLWLPFQATASSLTHLYRERLEDSSSWGLFQTAAGSLTSLYRDSNDEIRRLNELSRRTGYQRCRRDLVNLLLRGKRRYLRRDELLSVIASLGNGGVAVNSLVIPLFEPQINANAQRVNHKRPHPSSPSHDVHMDSPVWKKHKQH
uniref:UPF0472 protein C16orf72 homolog [Megachile rotundata] n=1 Tax=Lepeophtheirus salmonis TaxID=72036 RepID=A0A0K2SYR9_LEPSM|nr:UPF0472 protein C16orf72 homolog [Lepeophtheirus salmonis]